MSDKEIIEAALKQFREQYAGMPSDIVAKYIDELLEFFEQHISVLRVERGVREITAAAMNFQSLLVQVAEQSSTEENK